MNQDNITKEDGYRQFNLARDEVFDCWNSNYIKNLRKKMIAGETIPSCKRCLDVEAQGLHSMRSEQDKDFFIKNTRPDGTFEIKPKILELHFGNTCNLHCKMCSQMFSHSIGKELLKMGEHDPDFLKWVKKESGVVNNWTGELDVTYDWYKNDKIKKSIFENVSKHVEDLTVIGGEPTIIKEFYELLDYCNSNNTLKDKTLLITTNMTNTNKNLSTWLGVVKKFAIHASIDGLDDRNQYIRYPANWSSIIKSIDFYKTAIKQNKNGSFSFCPAIQLLNIDQIDELSTFFMNHFVSRGCAIEWVSIVRYPIICDYDILPTRYKTKISEKLTRSAELTPHARTKRALLSHANDLMVEKYTEEQKNTYQKMFIKYNDFQDKFRARKTWRQLIPDLEAALTNPDK